MMQKVFFATLVSCVVLFCQIPFEIGAFQHSTADRILNEHVKALGGKEQLRSIKSLVTEGSMSFADSEVVLEFRMAQVAGKYLLQLKSDEVEILQGFNGEIAWESSPSGSRLLEDEERVAAINSNAVLSPALSWSDGTFDGEIELTGRAMIEDRNCFVVDFLPTAGNRVRRYFDPESYMVLRYQTRQLTQSQSIDVLVKDSDWRECENEFAGIKLPYKQQVAADQKLLYTISRDSIEINVDVDSSVFDLPEAVKELIKN